MQKDHVDRVLDQWRAEKPDLDCSPMAVVSRLQRLAVRLDRDLQKNFSSFGLPPGGFDVLATLLRSGPPYRLSPNDLLDWMMVTSGTMTHRIDLLEKAGLARRLPNPADRRSVLIALTDAGRELIERALAAHLETQKRLLAGMDLDQQRRLADLMRAWSLRLDA